MFLGIITVNVLAGPVNPFESSAYAEISKVPSSSYVCGTVTIAPDADKSVLSVFPSPQVM
ncbi:hypothetical protein AYK24_06445 [Thermoplasmatales archaeon SG8-52-4]|nr:MAG: hypothetical protein AYK24_06445 [Thermoplasmatales archaeon SG8-52-4]